MPNLRAPSPAALLPGGGVMRQPALLSGSTSYPRLTKGIGMSLATTTQPIGRVDISVSGLTRYQNWDALLLKLKQELGPTTSSWFAAIKSVWQPNNTESSSAIGLYTSVD
ncbi:hypothetical protein EJB05_56065, partial [Eragrostis curvula]